LLRISTRIFQKASGEGCWEKASREVSKTLAFCNEKP
jgi:hypothetical protein